MRDWRLTKEPNKQNLLHPGRKKAMETLNSSAERRAPTTVPIAARWRNLLSDFNPIRDPVIAPSVPPTVNQSRDVCIITLASPFTPQMNSVFPDTSHRTEGKHEPSAKKAARAVYKSEQTVAEAPQKQIFSILSANSRDDKQRTTPRIFNLGLTSSRCLSSFPSLFPCLD